MKPTLVVAKLLVIVSVLTLLATTYTLSSTVLALVNHRIDGDEINAVERLARFDAAKQLRDMEFQSRTAVYKRQLDKYLEYIKKQISPESTKDTERVLTPEERRRAEEERMRSMDGDRFGAQVRPERVPPVDVQQSIAAVNAEFRADKVRFFRNAKVMNWVAGAAAMCLVGSLLVLICFDHHGPRLVYVVILSISFVFLIGPALNWTLTGIVWRLDAPNYESPAYPRGY